MYKHIPIGRVLLFRTAMCMVAMGFISTVDGGQDGTEILNITVGQPTFLSTEAYQNSAAVAVSRTGTVVAFYPKHYHGCEFYRISTDAGHTWGKELDYPPGYAGPMSVGLREGGVIFLFGERPIEGKHNQLEINRIVFTDDFLSWENKTATITMPNHMPSVDGERPGAAKGPIIQLPSGKLLMPMYGGFEGDDSNRHRSFLVQSIDRGRNWDYYATIAYEPIDPHPQLQGQYISACEPSVTLLPNGQMLAMLRMQYSHYPGEYKPLYMCWSNDLGRTWTKPKPTEPHLMTISPTLHVLDNGVVACQYGRPGFHVAFSLDNGHTWQDRISFSKLPEPNITGQFDMAKVGSNELVAIGSVGPGTKVWPIAVRRVKVAQSHSLLEGRVLDQQDNPIADAKVERGPNRYALDCWLEDTKPDAWGAGPKTIGSPKLAYRSIRGGNDYPTVQTDRQGHFQFESVKLGEYVLTVEADGHAPQHRHIKIDTQAKVQEFSLKPGQKVCNRIIDSTGQPVPGACVVLNRWHTHTDPAGFYHWSVEAPLPEQVTLRVYKRYSSDYETLEATVALSELESQPITLNNK